MTLSALDVRDRAILGLSQELSLSGYMRSGRSFRHIFDNGNIGFIGVQSSQSSSAACVKIRLSYGICCIELFQLQFPKRRPTVIDVHIGGLFEGEGAGDSWWTLLPETLSTDLVERIAKLAISKYIPWMTGHWQNDLIKSELQASRNLAIMPSAWLEFMDKK